MIDPRDIYQEDDLPTGAEKKAMWQTITTRIGFRKTPVFFIHDWRSFSYGIAAAFILYFAVFGAWQAVKQQMEGDLPAELKVDQAYRSAIGALEEIVPVALSDQQANPHGSGVISARQEQLQALDTAIANLRKETGGNDLSPVFRGQLRQLYSLKLQVLQQMIEHGEIEL